MLGQVVLRMLVRAVPPMLVLVDHAMLVRVVLVMLARVAVQMPALGVLSMLGQVALRMPVRAVPPMLVPVDHAMLVRVDHATLVPGADGIAPPFAGDSKGNGSIHWSNMALNLAPCGRWTLRNNPAQRRLALRWTPRGALAWIRKSFLPSVARKSNPLTFSWDTNVAGVS